jgi:hypothetical protein
MMLSVSNLKITLLIPLILVGCIDEEPAEIDRVQVQTHAEIKFAKSVLDALQAQSFELNREFCGYIGVNDAGAFVASIPTRGRKGSCRADEPDVEMDVLASYHTHGGYSDDHDSEVPSLDDLRADVQEGVDGYISTPGGRIWFNDVKQQVSRQLCGVKCVLADTDFQEDYDVPSVMTLDDHKSW